MTSRPTIDGPRDCGARPVLNLLYRYGELIDAGDLNGAAALFARSRIRFPGQEALIGPDELLAVWRALIRIYPCGTPRTKHVITNPLIEFDAQQRRAWVRSTYAVYQATDDVPLQVIAMGRYHDEFECISGQWHFSFRDYSLLDFIGRMEGHLTRTPGHPLATAAPPGARSGSGPC